ncbi:hypothetical protein HDU91_000899, partial [Kappamyces sp. JEL0680]
LIVEQNTKEKELKGAQQLVELYAATPQSGGPSPTELIQDVQNCLDMVKCQRTKLIEQMDILRNLKIIPIMPENAAVGAKTATVKFAYTAQKEGEVSCGEGDELEILESSTEDWVKAKNNRSGEVGLVPTAHILFIAKPPPKAGASMNVTALYDYKASEESELSFSVGDEIQCLTGIDADEEWWEGKNLKTGLTGVFNVVLTKGWEEVAAGQVKEMQTLVRVASVARQRQQSSALTSKRSSMQGSKNSSVISDAGPTAAFSPGLADSILKEVQEDPEGLTATALYDYESTCEGELSIEKGEVIRNIRKDTGSDQWWSGVGKHGHGQFPSNYVSLTKAASGQIRKVRALYDFSPASPGEIGFKAGDVLIVRQAEEPDW